MNNMSVPEVGDAPAVAVHANATAPGRRALSRFVTSAPVRMFVGLSVVASAVVEIASDFRELPDLWQNLGTEHGVLLVGIFHCLQALGDLLDGLDETVEARQEA